MLKLNKKFLEVGDLRLKNLKKKQARKMALKTFGQNR